MKTYITLLTLFIFAFGFSQQGEIIGKVKEDGAGVIPGLELNLIKDAETVSQTQTDFDGNYSFKNIPYGTYSLTISNGITREETYDSITVDTEKKVYDFSYPKPCISSDKVCPKGHKHHIIPIVYGLPNQKTMKKAKKNKVKLGGCNPYCEKWHCTEHDLDF